MHSSVKEVAVHIIASLPSIWEILQMCMAPQIKQCTACLTQMFGANKSSNLSPNGIPAGQWMNQTIGYFFICFSLKCSYNLEPKSSSKILQSYEYFLNQTWVKSTHCERQLVHNSLTPKIWLLILPFSWKTFSCKLVIRTWC